jgi:hypothetical protein
VNAVVGGVLARSGCLTGLRWVDGYGVAVNEGLDGGHNGIRRKACTPHQLIQADADKSIFYEGSYI